jgi:transposase
VITTPLPSLLFFIETVPPDCVSLIDLCLFKLFSFPFRRSSFCSLLSTSLRIPWAIDASLLAKTGRADVHDLRRLHPESQLVMEIKELTRDQDSLITAHTRLLNQLTACLKASDPAGLTAFSNVEHQCTLAFVRAYPTPKQAQQASVADLTTVLKKQRYPGAERKAKELAVALQQPQLGASEMTTRTTARVLLALLDQLEPLMRQIADDDKEIERLFFQHEDHELFQSLPGAGARLAPRMLADSGDDRSRSLEAASVHALGGTSPVLFQRGMSSKAHRRVGCITPLRNALQHCAFQSLREPWANAYDQRTRAEGKSQTVAVRALATVWVRIVFAIWQKREMDHTTTFEAAQLAHARRVA